MHNFRSRSNVDTINTELKRKSSEGEGIKILKCGTKNNVENEHVEMKGSSSEEENIGKVELKL